MGGHRGQHLGDVQPSLLAAGTAFDVDAGQAEHEGGQGFGGRRDEGRRLGEEGQTNSGLGTYFLRRASTGLLVPCQTWALRCMDVRYCFDDPCFDAPCFDSR